MKRITKKIISLILCLAAVVVPISVCFGGTVAGAEVPSLTADDFKESSYEYNVNLATVSAYLCYHHYYSYTINNYYCGKLGLSDLQYAYYTGNDEVDYALAHKTVKINDKDYTLLVICLNGTTGSQWYTNFDPGTGEVHKGFLKAKDFILCENGILDKYIKQYIPNTDNMKILLTGHSRGAAIVNLTAKDLIDSGKYVSAEDIYTYTFAAPGCSRKSDINDKKYDCIFNIINPEDLVGRFMPAGWGYGRYGRTLTLPSKTNGTGKIKTAEGKYEYLNYNYYYQKMNKKYREFRSSDYKYSENGEKDVYETVSKILKDYPTVEKMYKKKEIAGYKKFSLYEFFTTTFCPAVAESDLSFDNKVFVDCIVNMVLSWMLPFSSDGFKAAADYIVEKEGLSYARDLLSSNGIDVNNATPEILLKTLLPEDIYAKYGELIQKLAGFRIQVLLRMMKDADREFTHAHEIETYLCFTATMTKEEMLAERTSHEKTYKTAKDIVVTEKSTGTVVGRTVAGVVDKELMHSNAGIIMSRENNKTVIRLPNEENYEVKFVDKIKLETVNMNYSKTAQITAPNGTDVKWRTDDSSLISVDERGVVTAYGTGDCLVKCTYTDKNGNPAEKTVKVHVTYSLWQYYIRYFLLGFVWY